MRRIVIKFPVLALVSLAAAALAVPPAVPKTKEGSPEFTSIVCKNLATQHEASVKRAEEAYRIAIQSADKTFLHGLQNAVQSPQIIGNPPSKPTDVEEEKRISLMLAVLNNRLQNYVDKSYRIDFVRSDPVMAERLAIEWTNPDFVDAVKKGMIKAQALDLMIRKPDASNTDPDGSETLEWSFNDGSSGSGVRIVGSNSAYWQSLQNGAGGNHPITGTAWIEFDKNGIVTSTRKQQRK